MKNTLLSIAIFSLLSAPVMAQDLSIKVTNLTHGNHFTPLMITAHTANDRIYEVGTRASSEVKAVAEGGTLSGLQTLLDSLSADSISATDLTPPAMSQVFNLVTQANNTHLSVIAMVLPSNDAFVGTDSIEIPTVAGTYTYYMNAYDAGTEVNNEIILNGSGAPGTLGIPADPLGKGGTGGTGVAITEENTMVHIHRGVLGDTDSTGGISDLDSRIHRWLNPVAKLTITVK